MGSILRDRDLILNQVNDARHGCIVFVNQGWTPSMKRIVLPCVVGALVSFGTGAYLHIPLQIGTSLLTMTPEPDSSIALLLPLVLNLGGLTASTETTAGSTLAATLSLNFCCFSNGVRFVTMGAVRFRASSGNRRRPQPIISSKKRRHLHPPPGAQWRGRWLDPARDHEPH